ncbi:hypothetical protein V2J09_013978 [Rumex salicifolius]
MRSRYVASVFAFVAVVVSAGWPSPVLAGDVMHVDDVAPKGPGCQNDFVLVKIPCIVGGKKIEEYVGLGARFGPSLGHKENHVNNAKLVLSDPSDCCSTAKNKLAGEVILIDRGNCSFTTKTRIAEAAGASAVLIVNNETRLFKMVCEDVGDNNISIPAVMLSLTAGQELKNLLYNHSAVSLQLYSPERPEVDVAEVFLWLIAVGIILGASYWSAWTAREASIEMDKQLKDASDEFLANQSTTPNGFVNVNTTSAILFIVAASCFLLMLYKFMSVWFLDVLLVLFCIGGVEGLQTCLVTFLSRFRWFEHAAESTIKVPCLGLVSHLTAAVSPFCLVFAVVWAVFHRRRYLAWIGQDILGIALILTVLQIVRVPNLKVGTILLSLAFLYDIFWVFISKLLFHESVMISVARGGTSGEDGIPMLLKIPRMFDPWGGYSTLKCSLLRTLEVVFGFGLGTLLVLAKRRGELKIMWTRGEPERPCSHMKQHSSELEFSQ